MTNQKPKNSREQAADILRSIMDDKDKYQQPLYHKILGMPGLVKDIAALLELRAGNDLLHAHDTSSEQKLFESPAGQELFKLTVKDYIGRTELERQDYQRNFPSFLSEPEHAVLDLIPEAPKKNVQFGIDQRRTDFLRTDKGKAAFAAKVVDYLRPMDGTLWAQGAKLEGRVEEPAKAILQA